MFNKFHLIQVSKKLAAAFPGVYNETNIAISGIHTHSGPGGFHEYILLDVTSLGFVRQSMDALVNGIVEASIFTTECFCFLCPQLHDVGS